MSAGTNLLSPPASSGGEMSAASSSSNSAKSSTGKGQRRSPSAALSPGSAKGISSLMDAARPTSLDMPAPLDRPRSATVSSRTKRRAKREFPKPPDPFLASKSMSKLPTLSHWQKVLLRAEEEYQARTMLTPITLPEKGSIDGRRHLFDRPLDKGRKSKATPFTPPFTSPGIQDKARLRREEEDALLASKKAKELMIEDLLTLEDMRVLQYRFKVAHERKGLDLAEFKAVIFKHLKLNKKWEGPIEALFMKIDSSCDGYIDWREFCHYMTVEMQEKQESIVRQSEIIAELPALLGEERHRDSITRILATRMNTFVSMAGDGSLCFWDISGGGLQLTRYKEPFAKLRPPVKAAGLTKSMAERRGKLEERTPTWVIDMAYLSTYNKFMMLTAAREICFFDGTSTELQARLAGFDSVATRMHVYVADTTQCTLVYGDRQGCVNVVVFKRLGSSLAVWRKPPKLGAAPASVSVDSAIADGHLSYSRWKLHNDWVEEARYIPKYDRIISVSCDRETAVVMARLDPGTQLSGTSQDKDQGTTKKAKVFTLNQNGPYTTSVYKVPKGVLTFDFSEKLSILATGGMDHVLRLWDPHVTHRPTCMLKGHSSPIQYIHIDEVEDRIISMSYDTMFKIWEIKNSMCLLTVLGKGHCIPGDLQATCYHGFNRCLAIAGDQFGIVPLSGRGFSLLLETTHKDPVKCVRFNDKFNQVITACTASVVRVWDVNTGAKQFEYTCTQDHHSITDMSLDYSGRRLLTSGRDGLVKLWNYNNGQCLMKMVGHDHEEDIEVHRRNREIAALTVASLQSNYFVVSVGWSRHITVHPDIDGEEETKVPYPMWYSDKAGQGHEDEVTSVAFGIPDLLATGGYDGVICMWNIGTGQLIAKHSIGQVLRVKETGVAAKLGSGRLAVTGMLFLDRRHAPEADYDTTPHASLVSCGTGGEVLFWHYRRGFWDAFSVPRRHGVVNKIAAPKNNQFLVTGSCNGYMAVWDISEFGLKRDTPDAGSQQPEDARLLSEWQAHTAKINCVELLEQRSMVLTASDDKFVRLWTLRGHFVGSFGQVQTWSLDDPTTFQHPLVPQDVLTDAISIPECMASLGDFPKQPSAADGRRSKVAGKDDDVFDGDSRASSVAEVALSVGMPSAGSKVAGSEASNLAQLTSASPYKSASPPQARDRRPQPAAAPAAGADHQPVSVQQGWVGTSDTADALEAAKLDIITTLLHHARAVHRGQDGPAYTKSLMPSTLMRQSCAAQTSQAAGPLAASTGHRRESDSSSPMLGTHRSAGSKPPEDGEESTQPLPSSSPISQKDIKLVKGYLRKHQKDLRREITDLEVAEYEATEVHRDRGRHYKTAPVNGALAPAVRDSFNVGDFGLSWPKFPGRRLRQQLHEESKPRMTSTSTTFSQLTLVDLKNVEMPEDARQSFLDDGSITDLPARSPLKLGLEDFERELRSSDKRKQERAKKWKVAERKSHQATPGRGGSQNEARYQKMVDQTKSKDGWWNRD